MVRSGPKPRRVHSISKEGCRLTRFKIRSTCFLKLRDLNHKCKPCLACKAVRNKTTRIRERLYNGFMSTKTSFKEIISFLYPAIDLPEVMVERVYKDLASGEFAPPANFCTLADVEVLTTALKPTGMKATEIVDPLATSETLIRALLKNIDDAKNPIQYKFSKLPESTKKGDAPQSPVEPTKAFYRDVYGKQKQNFVFVAPKSASADFFWPFLCDQAWDFCAMLGPHDWHTRHEHRRLFLGTMMNGLHNCSFYVMPTPTKKGSKQKAWFVWTSSDRKGKDLFSRHGVKGNPYREFQQEICDDYEECIVTYAQKEEGNYSSD